MKWATLNFGRGNYEISETGTVRNKETGSLISTQYSVYGYAFVNLYAGLGKTKMVLIHRAIYENFVGHINRGQIVDHIDGDRSNNVIENLQAISRRENALKGKRCKNKTGYVGVSWHKVSNRWRASIRVKGKKISKYFTDIEEAGNWYESMKALEESRLLAPEEATSTIDPDF